jgi:phosphate regulon transcriptional regulator PhoB
MKQAILVVDDEPDVVDLVRSNLEAAGFKVFAASDGAAAIERARSDAPALIVLDLMLPELSGSEVCKLLKRDPSTAAIPIIMLTAKAEEIDRVVGLELGADDYVTKPFSPRELVLRVKSVLRRAAGGGEEKADVLKVGDITVDQSRCRAFVRGKPVELTATEFKLLAMLLERRGVVQSREKLLNDVWGYDVAIESRTVDTHMRRLREKLGRAADCIETVRGFGYRITDDA